MSEGDVLRLGVLGAAKISKKALYAPAADMHDIEVVAIAARQRNRAEDHAVEHGIDTVHDGYEQLLADPLVDAVYNPLPINLHHRWTVAALEAGKHVLCEKPFASNALEARSMVETADRFGRTLVEAFHWRYHPLAERIRAVLTDGTIGEPEAIDAGFTAHIDARDDVRHSYELSGGALMDLGCYPIQWTRFAGNCLDLGEPVVVSAAMTEGRPKVDVITDVQLAFAGGVNASVTTAMDSTATFGAWLAVQGSQGSLHVQNPLAPHVQHDLVITTSAGEHHEQVAGRTTYHHQMEAFVAAVRDGREVPTGGHDAIATMDLIDASYRAADLPLRGA